MKIFNLLLFFIVLNVLESKAQALYFPPLSGTTWDTSAPQSLNWCQERIDSLYNFLQAKNSKSFILLKKGKIVLEKYFGTYTADSVFYWASASKSLASFITGIAQQKNYVNISNPVSQYLGIGWSSETPTKEGLIAVKNLLEMTSGMEDNPPLPCNNEDTAKACLFYKVDASNRWAYHTGAYKKVQSVVSAAVGQNYNIITNNWVKNKIGMSGLWIDQTYYSKARDMARFGLCILNKGIWNNDTILNDAVYFNSMVNTSQIFNPAYGYLWWLNGKAGYLNPGIQLMFNGAIIPNAPNDLFCALGKNDQKIYVVPSSGLVVIRQGNSAEGVTFALSTFDNRLWDYINKLSCSNVGTPEFDLSETILIFPNPANNEISIKCDAQILRVNAMNCFGMSENLEIINNKLDASSLRSGLYFLRIELATGESAIRKVVIN